MSLKRNSFGFEEFILDANEKVLFRNAKPLSITPKALQLLFVMVENHGRLIEKNELIKLVWADSFVEEVNLAFTISVLRKLLGDEKSNPRFIETVPRRGYRFIAAVKEIEHTSQPLPAKTKTFNFKPFVVQIIAVLFIVLISITFWLAQKKVNGSAAPILTAPIISEKLSTSGKVSHAAISPDGKLIAFADKSGEKFSVWLRKLETSENIQIVQPSNETYYGMTFSHDGQTLFFVRGSNTQDARAAVYRVSAFGGIPKKIIDFAEGWISLSPDDKQISFVRCTYNSDEYCSLMIADADGLNEKKLISRPHPIRISDNQFSPDGKSIAFAAGNSENAGTNFQLFKFDLANGIETEISSSKFFNITSLKWLPDGNDLLLTAFDQLNGRAKIWRTSVSDGKTEALTNDAANYLEISLNNEASRLLAVEVSNNFQIYLSENGQTKPLAAAREVEFTSDGTLIFSADDNDIWTIGRNGGEQRQLTNNQFKDFSPIASFDRKLVYFTSNRTGTSQVWRMNSDGSNQIQITKNEGGYPFFVTKDGKWIYYVSGLQKNVWKVSADGGAESLVIEKKVLFPAISTDGNFIAFFFRDKDDQIKIGLMTLNEPKELKTLEFAEPKSLPVRIAWSPDNKTVNYITFYESKNILWKQSLDEEKPHFVMDLGNKEIEHFAISADGNSYAYTSGEWLHNAVLLKKSD